MVCRGERRKVQRRWRGLKGEDKGRYAVWVSGNHRITFAWDGEDAIEVDLEDYH
jgi:toxin HigB-1